MFGILLKAIDSCSFLLLGVKREDDINDNFGETNVKYNITSVFPSKTTMLEAQKYL